MPNLPEVLLDTSMTAAAGRHLVLIDFLRGTPASDFVCRNWHVTLNIVVLFVYCTTYLIHSNASRSLQNGFRFTSSIPTILLVSRKTTTYRCTKQPVECCKPNFKRQARKKFYGRQRQRDVLLVKGKEASVSWGEHIKWESLWSENVLKSKSNHSYHR